VFNGTSINDETNFGLEAIDFTPPKKLPEWAQSSDNDGADLIRAPRYENRTVTMTLRVGRQASMDAALAKVGALVDLLQEAEKNPGGIPLEWTPATGTKKYTLYVLTGEILEIPVVNEGSSAGFYVFMPQLKVQLTCKPFGYGVEEEVAAAKSIETGLSVVVLTVASMPGDVPAEGRLVIKDTAAVGRRFVEWGLENRYYNASTSLILDSEDMTPVGGTQVAITGAYKRAGATFGVIRTALSPEPTICCNTGVLKHVGTYRVKARVQLATTTGSGAQLRLSWQDGEGPLRANTWQEPPVNVVFSEVDLGVITLTPAILGSQKWLGQIEAYSPRTPGVDTLAVDYLTFIPVLEGYGKARGMQSTAPGTIDAFDNFTTGTLSGSLNARTPPVGAAWATSGVATDWAVNSGSVTRSTNGVEAEPRFGVFGPAISGGTVRYRGEIGPVGATGTPALVVAVITRWVDSNNYAFCEIERKKGAIAVQLGVKVAGVVTIGPTGEGSDGEGNVALTLDVELTAAIDGELKLSVNTLHAGAYAFPTISKGLTGSFSALATGGALVSGKGGAFDRCKAAAVSAVTRTITGVTILQRPAVPYCVQPSRTMEVHSDSTLTADSTGTYYGPPPQYRGSRFYVPQKGSAGRTSRIIVKADRNDLQESDQSTIADAFTAAVWATPRFLAIPR
jgi:hypothetical protein